MDTTSWQIHERHNRTRIPRLAVFTFVFVALVAFSVFFQPVVVQGKSMLPALQDGQFVLMDRQYYRWNTVRKDDIVVFRRGSDLYVKRVYATAGKTVQIVRSSDGTASLPESLGPPQRIAEMLRDRPDIGRLVAVRVPPRCVFVVGDNVNSSMDSRDFGPIPDKAIMGYVPGPAPGADSVLADTGALRIAHR